VLWGCNEGRKRTAIDIGGFGENIATEWEKTGGKLAITEGLGKHRWTGVKRGWSLQKRTNDTKQGRDLARTKGGKAATKKHKWSQIGKK